MKKITSILLLSFLPLISHAQTVHVFLKNFIDFINSTLIPFLIGIAFLFFIVNVIRYFVAGAANEQSREKAKALAIYGISAFVLIVVFWGIVNMLSSSIGLDNKTAPTPDYIRP